MCSSDLHKISINMFQAHSDNGDFNSFDLRDKGRLLGGVLTFMQNLADAEPIIGKKKQAGVCVWCLASRGRD